MVDSLLAPLHYSIASKLYALIRDDVDRKVAALPTRRLRAAALLQEASDQERSHTVDAYIEAAKLYRRALEILDARWVEPKRSPLPRAIQVVNTTRLDLVHTIRVHLSRHVPPIASADIRLAQAAIGYVNCILHRRLHATMGGRRLDPVLEAKPIIEDVIEQLELLGLDVLHRRETLFDALVTLALTNWCLDNEATATASLRRAYEHYAGRSEEHPRYMFVWALLETSPVARLDRFQRAHEMDRTSELAQLNVAVELEDAWRRSATLDPAEAGAVIAAYKEVLNIDPGNLSAWANMGYVYWLVGDLDAAADAFEHGAAHRSISAVLVAEFQYGLARLQVERCVASRDKHCRAAYENAVNAVASYIRDGAWRRRLSNQDYYYRLIDSGMLRRYSEYCERVTAWLVTEDSVASERVRDHVLAFVLNDCGEAYYHYWLRTSDEEKMERARALFERATHFNPGVPGVILPMWNLNELDMFTGGPTRVDDLRRLMPEWHEADMLLIDTLLQKARRAIGRDREGVRADAGSEIRRSDVLGRLLPTTSIVDARRVLCSRTAGSAARRRVAHWAREIGQKRWNGLVVWAQVQALIDDTGVGISLLNGIAEWFLEEDISILLTLRATDPSNGEECLTVVRRIVLNWLAADPTYWALTYVDEPYFTASQRAEVMNGLLRRKLPARLRGWVKQQLQTDGSS